MKRVIENIYSYSNIGVIPGVRGQRAFPTGYFKDSDPYLMLDHIGPQKVGKGYFLDGTNHAHPHRGFETLTFMFEGRMDHVDSLGNKAVLTSGSVQRMNAGKGIIHGGDMSADQETERFHEMQLWINNPSAEKMSEPDIHNVSSHDIPVVAFDNAILKIVSGKLNNTEGPIKTKATTQIGHVIASGKSALTVDSFEEGHQLMVYTLEGEAKVNGQILEAHHLAVFGETGDSFSIETEGYAQLLIMAGAPINEPVVFGGPFVMNTQAEINQANIDFQKGLFGNIK